MKKKAVLVAYVALLATPVAVMAQYPQLTEEAKAKYDKMITEARRRSDEAWAKALPIIEKEAEQGRPYIPWFKNAATTTSFAALTIQGMFPP